MRNTKTRLGLIAAGTGAAAIAVAGFALPANADDSSWSSETSHTATATDVTGSLDAFQTWVSETIAANDNTVAPETGVSPDSSVGDVTVVEGPLVGDVLTGPIGSGNDTPIGSGNDVSAPVGSGNDTSVDAPVGSGNDVSAPIDVPVEAPIDVPVGSGNESTSDTDVSVGDIGADVDNLVNGLTSDLGVGDILG